MDTLRGSFDALDQSRGYDAADDEAGNDVPPAIIGQDERRMQVRAYNHWAGLLEDRNFPAIDDLEPDNLPDFGPYSVLLDFSAGIENPGIAYLGDKLAVECDVDASDLQNLDDVPSRSLLSRITDHYMQILANQAPIGFEAEFVNQRGNTILYRGILLPFSSDDDTIDFIYGVINWKELADQHTSDELLLEIDQALDAKPEPSEPRRESAPLTDWADGPGVQPANDLDSDDADAIADANVESSDEDLPRPGFDPRAYASALDDEDDEDEDGEVALPSPTFGLSAYDPSDYAGDEEDEEEDEDYEDEGKYAGLVSPQELEQAAKRPVSLDPVEVDEEYEVPGDYAMPHEYEPEDYTFDGADEPVVYEPASAVHEAMAKPVDGPALPDVAAEDMQLGDWLAAAREQAAAARSSEDRTRTALYEAIGRAYDFSLAAEEKPEEFSDLLADSGLTTQDRAPMTPIVKLVFGADYDKTRLTEYAAALSHARRFELERGTLAGFLREAEGGLKGVVKAERRLRREEAGKAVEAEGEPREELANKLRELQPVAFDSIAPDGTEFALVMVRRTEQGELLILGEVPEDVALIERAARKLVG